MLDIVQTAVVLVQVLDNLLVLGVVRVHHQLRVVAHVLKISGEEYKNNLVNIVNYVYDPVF